MRHAKGAQQIALRRRTGGGDNSRPQGLGDLDGGHADAAGGAMDEHPFAFLQVRKRDQRVIGGQERDRDGGRILERQVARQFCRQQRGHRDMGGECRRRERDDAVADFEILDR